MFFLKERCKTPQDCTYSCLIFSKTNTIQCKKTSFWTYHVDRYISGNICGICYTDSKRLLKVYYKWLNTDFTDSHGLICENLCNLCFEYSTLFLCPDGNFWSGFYIYSFQFQPDYVVFLLSKTVIKQKNSPLDQGFSSPVRYRLYQKRKWHTLPQDCIVLPLFFLKIKPI